MQIATQQVVDANGKQIDSYNYANITTQTTTLVKTGAGVLHSITFNKPVATGTVEYDDALSNIAPSMGIVTVPANPQPFTLVLDIVFSTGLSVTTGVAAQDITIAYL